MRTITVHVEEFGDGTKGPFRAGMAIIKLDGKTIAKLRTTESIEIEVDAELKLLTRVS